MAGGQNPFGGVSSRNPTNNQLGRRQQVKTRKKTKTVLMRQAEGLNPYKLQGWFCHSSTLPRRHTVLHWVDKTGNQRNGGNKRSTA